MSTFLKDFNYSVELVRLKNKYGNSYVIYGLVGEERVAYQLKKCNEDIICLYNVILKIGGIKVQYDFIVITFNKIYVLEVKNLLGNIRIKNDLSIERIIYKKTGVEKSGMENPFIQINYQVNQLKKFCDEYNFKKNIEGLLIMGNDKTIIFNESNNKKIYKYEEIYNYFINEVKGNKLNNSDYELGKIILYNNNEYNYALSGVIRDKIAKQYVPKFNNAIDQQLYIEIIKLRQNISKQYNMPMCNVFTNRDAENLVISKPKNKEEFINIRGFKEKKYNLFGEEVINIFKNK